jgi:hypothetical protein
MTCGAARPKPRVDDGVGELEGQVADDEFDSGCVAHGGGFSNWRAKRERASNKPRRAGTPPGAQARPLKLARKLGETCATSLSVRPGATTLRRNGGAAQIREQGGVL